MSHGIDGVYAVYRETLRCASKDHACDACAEPILKGHRYYTVTWVFDGSASGCKRCLRCQAIHLHLRDKAPGEMWPDEELNCGEEYSQHWGIEPPAEIAELAFKTGADLQ